MSELLQALSDQEILERTTTLVAHEREDTLSVLRCLNEIEARDLYLKLGYGSLFDYCTKGLGYSSSAAWRRIQTARCAAKFTSLYEMLERNEVNLSTVSQASRFLNESNSDSLLARISDRTKREVESILAEYQPPLSVPERATPIMMHLTTGPAASFTAVPELFASATPADCENNAYCRSGSNNEQTTSAPAEQVEKRVLLRFSVSPEFMAKLERVRTVAWHRLPARATIEQILEFLLDEFIERHDPVSRQKRRERRRKGSASVEMPEAPPGERYIPASVRDLVFERDGGRCTYVGSSGKRCESTLAVQLDHIVPVALGGTSTPENLRLLCAKHNRLEAGRLLGPGVATTTAN